MDPSLYVVANNTCLNVSDYLSINLAECQYICSSLEPPAGSKVRFSRGMIGTVDPELTPLLFVYVSVKPATLFLSIVNFDIVVMVTRLHAI